MSDTEPGESEQSPEAMLHLLNCRECDWHDYVEGSSALADVARERHEDSIRNWRSDEDHCPKGSVAWAFLQNAADR